MNPNASSPIGPSRALSGEVVATAVGVLSSGLLLAKKLFGSKAARPEPMSRADFYAELAALKDHGHANHLAILEKLDTNHRELLAAMERLATRINALEAGFARIDERTRK